jgi:hypothetical protein
VTGSLVPPTANDPHDMQYESVTSVQTFSCSPEPCTPPPPIVDVTYNDETGEWEQGFVDYPSGTRVVHPGYSSLGYSLSTDGGNSFQYQPGPKIRPPAWGTTDGWDALWGDPAITSSRVDQNHVYISSLAVSHQSMLDAGGSITGFVQTACNGNSCIDGACIAVSRTAGQTFDPIDRINCLSNNRHFYDGGSMESDLNGGVYAAFNDVTARTEDVWYSPTLDPWLQLHFGRIQPGPFGGLQMESHPRLRFDPQTGRLYIMGLADPCFKLADGQAQCQLFIDFWDGTHWHGPVPIGQGDTIGNPTIQRGFVLGQPAPIRTGGQFSFDVGTPSVLANDDIRIVYTSERNTPGRLSLRSYVCTRDLQCTNVGFAWSTQYAQGQQYNPVVVAQPFFITVPAEWVVSYNSTEFDPGSTGTTLSFMAAHLVVDSNGHYVPWSPLVLVHDTPVCPELDGQWGDYDDLQVLSITNNVPTFIRTHTDSTESCTYRDEFWASPLHVSAHMFQ